MEPVGLAVHPNNDKSQPELPPSAARPAVAAPTPPTGSSSRPCPALCRWTPKPRSRPSMARWDAVRKQEAAEWVKTVALGQMR